MVRDWFEILITALGLLFLGLAAIFLIALGIDIASWGEPPPPELNVSSGLFTVNKAAGLAVFSIGALLFTAVGWSLAGSSIRAGYRRLRGRTPVPAIPPKADRTQDRPRS
jgi:hypothetical protein